MTYYIKGGSRYNEANPTVWCALILGGFSESLYTDVDWKLITYESRVGSQDPYWLLGGATGGAKEFELGLYGDYRIKFETTGITYWDGDSWEDLLAEGGAENLNELTDVVITGTPADNEGLFYDTGTSKWINQTAGEAGLALSGHEHTLDQITNPSGDKEFNFANKHLHYKWVAPASGAHEGAFEIEASGAFSGDLMHIHQHTGVVGAGTYMVFIECEHANASCLHLVHDPDILDFGAGGLLVGADARITEFDTSPLANSDTKVPTNTTVKEYTDTFALLKVGGEISGNITCAGAETFDGVDVSDLKTAFDALSYYTQAEVNGLLHPQAHTLASHTTKAHAELSDAPTSAHHVKTVKYTAGEVDARIVVQNTHPAGTTDIAVDSLILDHKNLPNDHHTLYTLEQHNNTYHSTNYHTESDGTGVVTVHSDMTSAGSGAIITTGERADLHAIYTLEQHNNDYHSTNYLANISEDTSPEMLIEDALASDGDYEGIVITITNAQTFGLAVYIVSDNTVALADKDSATTMPPLGLSVGTNKVLIQGTIREDDWDWTANDFIYIGDSGALIDDISGFTIGDIVYCIGVAVDANTIAIKPMHWVELSDGNLHTLSSHEDPTVNIPMAGYKFTGLGAGTTSGDSVRYEQLHAEDHDNTHHTTNYHTESDGIGVVTIHSDMTSAGSGAIITTAERNALHPIVTSVYNLRALDDRDYKPNTANSYGFVKAFFTSLGGMTGVADSDYQDLLILNTYTDGSGGDINALTFDKSTQLIKHWLADQTAATWGTPKTIAYTDALHTEAHDNTYHTTNYHTEAAGTGVVTVHSDMTSAGSGAIITTGERNALHTIYSLEQHNNAFHSTNYEVANANIQSHVASPPTSAHHVKTSTSDIEAVSINNLSEDASPQLGADLDLNGKTINCNGNLGSDHTFEGLVIDNITNAQAFGKFVYIISAHTTALCDKDSVVSSIGVSVGTGEVLYSGTIRDDSWAAMITIGAPVYIGDDGNPTDDISGYATGDMVQCIGVAIDTNLILIKDICWVEIV